MNLDVHLDPETLRRTLLLLGNAPQACHRALRRGVAKAAKKLALESGRNVSDALNITRGAMKARLRTYNKGDGVSQKVWLGMNAIAVHRLGKVQQTKAGVQVGSRFFAGAFVIRKYGGVYRRVGKARFPLELAKLEIEREAFAAMMAAYAQADDYLLKYVAHEIEWELSKL
jgi:hypothetical protein